MLSSFSYQHVLVQLINSVRFFAPHELKHAWLPCPSLSPRACSNSCPLSQWCHPTISSSVAPFTFSHQSFPASGSFPKSQLFCIRWPKYWSFSFNISPSNQYSELIFLKIDWFDLLVLRAPPLLQIQIKVSKTWKKIWRIHYPFCN